MKTIIYEVLLLFILYMKIRSVSFDTSFLLNYSSMIDKVIKKVSHDFIPCFITSTVASELEQLKIWGRITHKDYNMAMNRSTHAHASIIDFKNRLLSDTYGKACMVSMQKHHGVKPEDIKNDCSILVSTLNNGVDLFLSQDYHFTSKITKDVVKEITHKACREYHMMCDTHLLSMDADTFLAAYNHLDINLDIVDKRMKRVRKKGKLL